MAGSRASLVLLGIVLAGFYPTQTSRSLRIKETTLVENQQALGIRSPSRCDDSGNIYVQMLDPNRNEYPVVRISPDGKRVIRYSLASAPDLEKSYLQDFAVGPKGGVHILADNDGMLYLIAFSEGGSYDSKARINAKFMATQVGAFRSGNFLLAGKTVPDNESPQGSPFLAIFDSRGQPIIEVMLQNDVSPKPPKPPESATGKAPQPRDQDYERALSLSDIQNADDHNLYIMRFSPRGPVYVVSPGGEVQRRIELDPPKDTYLSDIRANQGKLLSMFVKPKQPGKAAVEIASVHFIVYDLSTGEKLSQFSNESPAELGTALACYQHDTLTFLNGDLQNRLQIVRAVPEP